MKIQASVRSIYDGRRPVYVRLRNAIDRLVLGWKDDRWHYESRVKEVESFALKAETGRFPELATMEDFFALTLVVPNLSAVAEAELLVSKHFKIHRRRPTVDASTHKSPDAFPFDDLRLYASLIDDGKTPPSDLEAIEFEIQIKTFLQHAWSIATHDLIYKGGVESWSTQRIAYQVKAMLEHAEISISQADDLAKATALAKSSRDSDRLNEIIEFIQRVWKSDRPKDTRRLAQTVVDLSKSLRVSHVDIITHVDAYIADRTGQVPTNLSPYQLILEALINRDPNRMKTYLNRPPDRHNPFKLLITPEIALPSGFDISGSMRAVCVPPVGL